MGNDRRIDYIEFPSRDLEASTAFHAAVFGWTFQDYGPDYRAFNDGRLDGGFYRADSVAAPGSGGALVVLYADDLEATLERVRVHGGTILKDIFAFPGGRRFHFAEPGGNELAVWSDR